MIPCSPEAIGRPLSILVVNPDVPPPDRDSGSLRLFRLLELLAADGHRLTLVGRVGVGQAEAVRAVEALGVEVHPVDAERAPVPVQAPPLDLQALLARVRPDVAWLSFFPTAEVYLPLLRRWAPATKVVVDTVDVHWVREARAAELSGSGADAARARQTREREAAAYGAADALVAVSADDAAALRELAPQVPVSVISNVHPPEPAGPPRADRDGALFVGNFRHTPNVDAAVHLVRDVWPLVRAQLPGARLQLVGTAPPPAVQALAAADVEVTGWVPDTRPYVDGAAVSVAPLRYGAGVKGKIGEALAHGLPVVTTTVGAEGMDLEHGRDALVADTPEHFAAAIVAVHRDGRLWERLASGGRAAIERTLSPRAALDGLRGLLERLVPPTFIATGAPLDEAALNATLAGYLGAFAPADAVSLVVPAPPQRPLQELFDGLATTIAALGHDLEAIPDVAVSPWAEDAALPASAVVVGAGEDAVLRADAPAQAWRAAAEPVDRGPRPRASLVVRLPRDGDEAGAQLDAVLASGVPADVELLLAVADGDDVGELARRCPDARVVAADPDAGRARALRRAAMAARGATVVVLEPHALPAPDFMGGLVAEVEAGAALAGAVVDGAHGLRVAPDGTLWPLRAGEVAPDALPLDCLAASRDAWLAMPMALPSREGHAEAQLAAWAARRGSIAVAGGAVVRRAPAPPATVVVCTRDRADVLADTIELVVGQGAAEVVIVDNGSTDATPDVAAALAERHPTVRVVAEPEAGLSHARNAGARAASHELLVFLDDDARPAPGWLAACARELARDGVVSAGGPIVGLWPEERDAAWPAPGLEPLYGILDYGDADRTVVAPVVVYGGNWCVRRSALEAVGGFDPSFGVGPNARIGGEEVSVTWRLQRAGLGATRYVAAAGVGHLIQARRLNERFLVERALTVGLERPRYLEAPTATDLTAAAGAAAQRLLRAVALAGRLRLEDAVEAVVSAPAEPAVKVHAATALGELAACVLLLGETEAHAGALELAVRPEHLHGLLDAVRA
ncbi:MAG TPA: glycosyltransferase [Baekduia sp.]|nr:glycosyltransferase [Baekduia sp.]